MLFSIFLQYSTETKRSPVPLPNQKTLQVKVAKNSWKTSYMAMPSTNAFPHDGHPNATLV